MSTEVRTEENPSRVEVLDFVYPDDPPNQIRQVPIVWPAFRRFYEEITPNSGGSRVAWKKFDHYKMVTTLSTMCHAVTLSDFMWSYRGSCGVAKSYDVIGPYLNRFGEAGAPITGLQSFYEKRIDDGGFVPPPSNLNDLIATAYRSMAPGIKRELSLINSLVELKDFRSLPSTILHCKDTILRSGYSLLLEGRKAIRQYLRAGSDAYLQAQFNIMPLLSDISGIHAALVRTESQVRDILLRMGKRQRRHFRCFLAEDADFQSSSFTDHWDGQTPFEGNLTYHTGVWDVTSTREVFTSPAQFHAEMEYTYSLSQFQVEHARILALLDGFGVNLNPTIIWNAIPWTFVVDWLLGVSSWLNSQRLNNMEPQINIHNFLWSIKRHRQITNTQTVSVQSSYSGVDPPLVSKRSLPVVTETAYRRQPGIPSTDVLVASGLSLKEFSLASALVLSRGRRPKHSRSPWLGSLLRSIANAPKRLFPVGKKG